MYVDLHGKRGPHSERKEDGAVSLMNRFLSIKRELCVVQDECVGEA